MSQKINYVQVVADGVFKNKVYETKVKNDMENPL